MTSWRRLRVALPIAGLLAGGVAVVLGTPVAASAGGTVDPDASVAYQHDAAHDGDSTDPWFVAPFARSWSATFPGAVGYPLVVDDRVFVTVAHYPGYGNDVEALSLATGDVLWGPVSIGGTYWTGRIAYDDGRIFAINYDGELTALDATTGPSHGPRSWPGSTPSPRPRPPWEAPSTLGAQGRAAPSTRSTRPPGRRPGPPRS